VVATQTPPDKTNGPPRKRVNKEQTAMIETIPPQQARAYLLQTKADNRRLRQAQIDEYGQAMKAGRWELNGEAIIFDWFGDLREGQHRLRACEQYDVPFTTWVVRGVDPDSFLTMDTGLPRRSSDYLGSMKEAITLSALLKIIYLWEQDRLADVHIGTKKAGFTPAVQAEVLRRHPDAEHAIPKARAAYKQFDPLPKSFWSFCHYALPRSGTGQGVAESFLVKLETGTNLSAKSPILLLRKRLTDNATNQAKLPAAHLLALTLKAWQLYVRNRRVDNLRWAPDREAFPSVRVNLDAEPVAKKGDDTADDES
jgi:hypothetical protein